MVKSVFGLSTILASFKMALVGVQQTKLLVGVGKTLTQPISIRMGYLKVAQHGKLHQKLMD